jgi:hypothetical protein
MNEISQLSKHESKKKQLKSTYLIKPFVSQYVAYKYLYKRNMEI